MPELLAFAGGERTRTSGRGAILMGDLNAEPGEAIISALESKAGRDGSAWLDVWSSSGKPRGRGGTYPSVCPFRRIDYVFLQPQGAWQVHRCGPMGVSGSDHRGVVAWLSLLGEQNS